MSVFYTGKGDKGETDTLGMGRMEKDSVLASALGDIDEANSVIGVAIVNLDDERIASMLKAVQNKLFAIGAQLISTGIAASAVKGVITEDDVKELEKQIDEFDSRLPALKEFVLPGGSISASYLHHARTVARRAERSVIMFSKQRSISPPVISYLNRLSSFLFAAALIMNKKEGVDELNPTY